MNAAPAPSVASSVTSAVSSTGSTIWGWVKWILYLAIIGGIIYGVYYYFTSSSSSGSSTTTATGGKDGKDEQDISAKNITAPQGQWGIQYWMLISDWDYKYGSPKGVLTRTDGSGNVNPEITLHPTDNKMIIKISYLPADHSAGDDMKTFECVIPSIPIQSWFSVSVSMQQRNLDIYMNGALLKSCFIPGVPINVVSGAKLSPSGGFSGKVSDVVFSSTALQPSDAMTYYQKGSSAAGSSVNSLNPISRYNLKLSVVDSSTDKEIKTYMT
jgi:hypothetical protein